jgi:hypothetical protein
MTTATIRPYLVLRPEDHVVLGEAVTRACLPCR